MESSAGAESWGTRFASAFAALQSCDGEAQGKARTKLAAMEQMLQQLAAVAEEASEETKQRQEAEAEARRQREEAEAAKEAEKQAAEAATQPASQGVQRLGVPPKQPKPKRRRGSSAWTEASGQDDPAGAAPAPTPADILEASKRMLQAAGGSANSGGGDSSEGARRGAR